jgi:2-keto-4-pentenoate hydratase
MVVGTERTIRAAEILYGLRLTVTTMDELPAEMRPESLAAGYEIQNELVNRLEARYRGTGTGYKIACTNLKAQMLLNTDAPVFGRLSSCFTRSSPARINAKEFPLLGIEPEFAFEIAKDVSRSDTPYTADTIADYIRNVMPTIELVGHRFSSWNKFDAPILAADNAIHQAWIPGTAVKDWEQTNFSDHPVELIVNGNAAMSGSGANVLGNPLNALAWLANELPLWGRSLKAGDLITTGTCTDVYMAHSGDKIRADFADLGGVDLKLA